MENGMFTQVSNAYRLAAAPPTIPGPVQIAVGLLLNSKSESRAETRLLIKQRASDERSDEVRRDADSLEAALARLGAAIQSGEPAR
jgi:hypothetical protein